jgi:hypothetical protein
MFTTKVSSKIGRLFDVWMGEENSFTAQSLRAEYN